MAITRDEMFHKLTLRYEELVCKYADKNVTDKQFFEELTCSVYAGDELRTTAPITLDEDYSFKYKGYVFELTPCTILSCKQDVLDAADEFRRGGANPVFTDRYVCWMYGHKDTNGHTLEEYLELNTNETKQNNYWVPRPYLVPDAWAWGAESDCNPGDTVDKLILDKIDEFLKQNPDL